MLFFFFFFESIPAGADHVSPLREQFIPTCRLEPANNLSFTTPFLIMYSHSNPEWQDLQRQLLGSTNIWRRGKIWGGLLHSSTLFLTERNSCELHTEDEVNKSSDAQPHSTANIQMHFPHHECRRHSNPPRLSPPDSARGNWGLCMQRSLDQMLPTMCNSLQSKECDSSPLSPDSISMPLLVIAHSVVEFQQPLRTGQTRSVNLWQASVLRFGGRSFRKLCWGSRSLIGKSRYA